jgi:hypothetical protein
VSKWQGHRALVRLRLRPDCQAYGVALFKSVPPPIGSLLRSSETFANLERASFFVGKSHSVKSFFLRYFVCDVV